MKTISVQKQNQLSLLSHKKNHTYAGSIVRSFTRTLAVAMLSLSSIQAAAGPDGGGPSPEQKAKMDAAIQAACGADFTNFCPTATGHHAKMECLRSNESNLSSTCSAFVAEMKAHRPPGPPPGPRPDDSSSGSSSGTSSAEGGN